MSYSSSRLMPIWGMVGLLAGSLTVCSLARLPEPLVPLPAPAALAETGVSWTDMDEIPGFTQMPLADLLPPQSEDVFQLSAVECACRAASQSSWAGLLEQESMGVRRESVLGRGRGTSRLLPAVLADQAAQRRIDSAEQALIAYYQLVHVQLQADLLGRSREELRRSEEAIGGLRQAGVPIDFDSTELTRRRSGLDLWDTQLQFAEARLTVQISTLIGEEPLAPRRIDTSRTFDPRPCPLTLSQSLATARSNNLELRSIQRVLHGGDVEDLQVARHLLQAASPLMGQLPVPAGRFAKLLGLVGRNEQARQELQWRQQQLAQLRRAREEQLDLEVANAVATVQEAYLKVGVAKDVLDSRRRQLFLLESTREAQQSQYGEVMEARGELIQAELALLNRLSELEIAHVRLSALLGTLLHACPDATACRCGRL